MSHETNCLDVSGGNGTIQVASGPVSASAYNLARLGLSESPSSLHAYLMFLTELLEGASAEHRGLAWSAAGGPTEDAACFYSLTGSGGSWVLHEYAAPAPPQNRAAFALLTEAGAAEELRTVALSLPTGYAAMTCHDVAVTGGTVFVLAEVADTSYLIPVAMGTFAEGAEVEVEDGVAARGALGVDGAGHLLRAYVTPAVEITYEEYNVVGGVPAYIQGREFAQAWPAEVLGIDGVPGSGGWLAEGGVYYTLYRHTDGSVLLERSEEFISSYTYWHLPKHGASYRALAYDWQRGYWNDDPLASYLATFTVLAVPPPANSPLP